MITSEDEKRVREIVHEEMPADPTSQRIVSWGCFTACVLMGIAMAVNIIWRMP